MPKAFNIVDHWHGREADLPTLKSHWIGLGEPFCFRCGWLPPVNDESAATVVATWRAALRWLDRAHLVDRAAGGLDDVQNVVLLCRVCHHEMPEFGCEDGNAAIGWVRDGRPRHPLWQVYCDTARPNDAKMTLKLWRRFNEDMTSILLRSG